MCQSQETCNNCAALSKLAAKNGYRLKPTLILSSNTKGYKVKLEKITEKVPIDRTHSHLVSQSHITKTSSAEKLTTSGRKTIGHPQTQSERSKARKMRRRQQQRDEIAAKRAVIATNQPSKQHESQPTNVPANDTNSLATFAVAEAIAGIEMIMPPTKRPKTHFCKTKKPGRI